MALRIAVTRGIELTGSKLVVRLTELGREAVAASPTTLAQN
jgi:hypothetical protein